MVALTASDKLDSSCPLCTHQSTDFFHKDAKRDYFRCPTCDLVFVPKHFHLSQSDEKAVYDLHENNPDDQGYRNFLGRLLTPLTQYLKPGQTGLDFGCGPGPTLSTMMREMGYKVEDYDIYYANHPSLLEQKYDFVTSTEVVEHLSQPADVFKILFSLLKPKGVLGLMTKRTLSPEKFANWHYINDPTHITFYSERTFEYLADLYHCKLELPGADTAILIKQP